MSVIGIIPARGGSKGIPYKNIKLLNGKPLIAYTIEASLQSNLDQVVVSTDCDLIAEISAGLGVKVMMRPSELAEDTSPMLPVIQHVLNKIDVTFEAVMLLQPTSPLRTNVHINQAIKLFMSDDHTDSLVSVVEIPHNFTADKQMTYDGVYLSVERNIKRRQDVATRYARNGAAIYMTKYERVHEYILGGNILPFFMSKLESFDIDDMDDWIIVDGLLRCAE